MHGWRWCHSLHLKMWMDGNVCDLHMILADRTHVKAKIDKCF